VTDFASFLLAKGAAGKGQVVAALEEQRRSRPPIGRVAIHAGMLDGAGVFGVLAHQARHPSQRFGEAAIELGILSRGQVDELLHLQRKQTPSLEAVLVKLGAIDEDAAHELREAYDRAHPGPGATSTVPRSRRTS
jgi:hypothetical protein